MNCGDRLVHASEHNRIFPRLHTLWRKEIFLQHLIFINQVVWIFYQCEHYEQRNFITFWTFQSQPKGVVEWQRVPNRQNWIWSKCCYQLVVYWGHILVKGKLMCRNILFTAKNSKELPHHYHRPKISRSC